MAPAVASHSYVPALIQQVAKFTGVQIAKFKTDKETVNNETHELLTLLRYIPNVKVCDASKA